MHNALVDDASFRLLASIVHSDCGIVLSDSKRNLVVSRLSRRLRDLRLPDFQAYCRYLEAEGGPQERRRMTSLLTTNVTKFFREAHHFLELEGKVLPPLIKRAKAGGRVRVWSAGCSSGQEPYSIAIKLLELLPDAAHYDIRILGTDIDPDMIRTGQAAEYTSVDDDQMPIQLRQKYFTATRDGMSIRAVRAVRDLVTFAELNLIQDWPMRRHFDVIFCRNVVIYFDADTQRRLWSRFAEVLATDGHLFVGHSERVSGPAEAQFNPAGVTQYRRV